MPMCVPRLFYYPVPLAHIKFPAVCVAEFEIFRAKKTHFTAVINWTKHIETLGHLKILGQSQIFDYRSSTTNSEHQH